jgi:iron complex outermembrane recepter protein
LNNPTQASASALAGDQARNVKTERIANRTTVRLDSGQLDIDSWFLHKNLYHPIFQVIDQDGYTYGFAPRYTTQTQIGGLRDEVVLGGRIFAGNNRALQFVNNGGSRGAQTVNARQNAWSLEGYVENRLYVLPDLAAVLGTKLFHAERQFTNLANLPPFTGVRQDNSSSFDGINPKIGLLWEPRKNIQAFIDLTRSQDVPDFSDLTQTQNNGSTAFVPLQAQKAWTLEIGTRGRHERFAWDVTLYRSWVNGQMLQFTTNPDIPAATFNAGRTLLQGVELGASMEVLRDITTIGDRLTLSQLWNWSDFRFSNDPQFGNNHIAGVPEHVLRTTLSYTHPSGFYVAPAVDWVPAGAFVDYANTQRVPNYVLLGMQAGLNFENGASVFLDARNLTNKRYISDFGTVTRFSAAGTQTFYPGDGRSVYVGTRLTF